MVRPVLRHSRPSSRLRRRLGIAAVQAALLLCGARTVLAHGGGTHGDDPWWTKWNWDPLILMNLALLAALYGLGLAGMWGRAGRPGGGISRWQAVAFFGALGVLVAALISPIDLLSDELSAVHMIQHMLLMMVAAPLFVLGRPGLVLLWGLPRAWRQKLGPWRRRIAAWHSPWYLLWQPILLWLLYAVTLWIWHLPALYQAALHHRWVHEVQHLTFFIAAALFWRVLLDPLGRLRLSRGVGVLYLFATSLHASVLGVFMALAPRPWYAFYQGRTSLWELTALEDQQLAGFIMWMPACMIYAGAAAVIFAVWLREFPDAEEEPF